MYQPRPAGYPFPLGDFVLTGPLGEGGSGAVYAAQWGHREVALKILHPSLVATESERERFFAEAQRLSEITHPGVVKVLNFGALPDGRPYLAMEKLDGETLADRLGRGRLLVGESLALFGQMVDAVEALHARGLVHRDLKPENVFLVDGGRYAVLLDFGIAKELDAPASTVTQDGGVRGTPAYMAPERFFGQPATPATDIYELGVVLFAMLVGRLPWDQVADPEARLNPRLPSALGVPLPGRLEAVLQRALSTRPESRPTSARGFLEEIDRALTASGPVRQTADAGGPAPAQTPRTTVDLGGPPRQPPQQQQPPRQNTPPNQQHEQQQQQQRAAYAALGHAPTVAMTPPHAPQPHPHYPPHYAHPQQPQAQPSWPPGYYHHQATTTAEGPPRPSAATGKPVWPWIVAAIAVLCAVAVAAVLILGKPDKPTDAASPSAAAGDDEGETDTATDGDQPNQLLPRPIPDGDDAARSALTGSRSGAMLAAEHHPADTEFLLVIGVAKLLADDSFGDLLRALANSDDVKPLLWAGAACKVDPLADVDWVAIGVPPDTDDDFDITVSGKLDHDAVESCARTMSDTPAHVWLDDRTLFFTTRSGIDASWLAARKAGTGSLATAHRADLAGLPAGASVAFLGRPSKAFGDDLVDPEFPDAESARGSITLGSEVAIDLAVRYRDASSATKAVDLVSKQIEDFPQGMLGTLKVSRDGSSLVLNTRINSLITEMIAHMAREALSAPPSDSD